jgi:hypothetical protein
MAGLAHALDSLAVVASGPGPAGTENVNLSRWVSL